MTVVWRVHISDFHSHFPGIKYQRLSNNSQSKRNNRTLRYYTAIDVPQTTSCTIAHLLLALKHHAPLNTTLEALSIHPLSMRLKSCIR